MKTRLSLKDLQKGQKLYNEEKISDLNLESMFRASIECILSKAERYKKVKSLAAEIFESGLSTPTDMLQNTAQLKNILSKVGLNNQKFDAIVKFSEWWRESLLPEMIIHDATTGREHEYGLRNTLAEDAPGLNYKTGSFLMTRCGYENVVPIDSYMQHFLHDLGYDIKVPKNKKIGGPKKREFLYYERKIAARARRRGISPASYHHAVWFKYFSAK